MAGAAGPSRELAVLVILEWEVTRKNLGGVTDLHNHNLFSLKPSTEAILPTKTRKGEASALWWRQKSQAWRL